MRRDDARDGARDGTRDDARDDAECAGIEPEVFLGASKTVTKHTIIVTKRTMTYVLGQQRLCHAS